MHLLWSSPLLSGPIRLHYSKVVQFQNIVLILFQNVLPVLKWVRGEPLSQDHWLELFRLLHMPRGTTLEKLNFGHILNASDGIIQNADALKV